VVLEKLKFRWKECGLGKKARNGVVQNSGKISENSLNYEFHGKKGYVQR